MTSRSVDPAPPKATQFSFDAVFGPDSTQEQVFEEAAPVLGSVLDGYSACIFAYTPLPSAFSEAPAGADSILYPLMTPPLPPFPLPPGPFINYFPLITPGHLACFAARRQCPHFISGAKSFMSALCIQPSAHHLRWAD